MSTEQTAEDPRIDRAVDVIVQIQRIENPAAVKAFMPQLRKDARLLLAAIDGPERTWRDVFKASRAAGWTRQGSSAWAMWGVWGDEDIDDTRGWVISHRIGRGRRVTVVGPGHGAMQTRSFTELVNPTPADVLSAARLVGLGGDSDER